MKKRKRERLRRQRNSEFRMMKGSLVKVYETLTYQEQCFLVETWKGYYSQELTLGLLPFVNKRAMMKAVSNSFVFDPKMNEFSSTAQILKKLMG